MSENELSDDACITGNAAARMLGIHLATFLKMATKVELTTREYPGTWKRYRVGDIRGVLAKYQRTGVATAAK